MNNNGTTSSQPIAKEQTLTSSEKMITLIANEMVRLGKIITKLENIEDRNFSYDIKLLLIALREVSSLVEGKKERITLNLNMWQEAIESLDYIIGELGLTFNNELSNYDQIVWVVHR
ncbi:hypothetical protein SFC65_19865 [Priestia filamentosa]|uniref:hypothetical protein n=1 Tax=Priestia filamentosa TaxID=1402861 RepID=UPI003981FD02